MLNVFFLHKDSFILLIIMSKQTDLTNAPNSNKELFKLAVRQWEKHFSSSLKIF